MKVVTVELFDELKPIFDDFCKEKQLTDEKAIERIQAFEKHFNREDTVYYLATVDDELFGYMSFGISNKLIHTHGLHIINGKNHDDLVFELITKVSNLLKSRKKEYLLIYNIQNLALEAKLKKSDFAVYQRVTMVYDLKENQMPEFNLDSEYHYDCFTLDRLDEELQIIVDANKNHIDGDIFKQFSTLENLKEFFYESKMDSERLRSDSPIVLRNGKVIGVNIITNLSESESYVWIIALLSEHRGKGLGKYLMLKAHENCKNTNIKQMILDVTIDNVAAFNLYKNLGYKETKRYLTVVKNYHTLKS